MLGCERVRWRGAAPFSSARPSSARPGELPLTSLAGVWHGCPTGTTSDGGSPLAPGCPLPVLPHPEDAASSGLICLLQLLSTAPLLLLPTPCHHTCSRPCSLRPDAHPAACPWAGLLWAALTPPLLDGHGEKRYGPSQAWHWTKVRPPETRKTSLARAPTRGQLDLWLAWKDACLPRSRTFKGGREAAGLSAACLSPGARLEVAISPRHQTRFWGGLLGVSPCSQK